MGHQFQISVRKLMLVVFVAGLGLAGLSTGGWMASAMLFIVIIVTTALAIVAFVGHGPFRAFAIGFLIPWLTYVGSHAYVGSSELDPYGKLPTTKLIRPVYELLVRREYINVNTGQPVPNYDPTQKRGLGGGGFGGGPPINVKESPDRATFMMLAHALFATAFAYAGGKFAVWVDRRSPKPKNRDEQS